MTNEYAIRLLETEEEPELLRLMKDCFEPSLEKIFSIHPESTFIALQGDTPVAGINLDIFQVNKTIRMGYISWLYTQAEHRGKGLAGKLLSRAMEFLQEQGCTDVCACIEGDNPASFKQLVRQGFAILPGKGQLALFRFGIYKVYKHASRFFDMGYFLYHYSFFNNKRERPVQTPSKALGVTLLGNTLLWFACLKGWNLLHLFGLKTNHSLWGMGKPDFALSLLLVPALFLGIRTLAMELSAKVQKIEVEYRSWDTAWILAFLTSFLIGIPFPVPGNLYIKGNDWDLGQMQPKLTMMARSSQLAIGIACLFFSHDFALRYILPLLFLDSLFFFYPFCGFNAKRIHTGSLPARTSSLALLLAVSLFVLL
ncbi:GNAT family N-acetyltransferase [uncultured Sphaerochaeta sp.]|uniref:GNAT family N-acetyltransferase n=1 Tax=uncultured Sphaerochaeta sp. TaxID=886478 RepID=UPI002A0A949D|nr:GNAT family N-acetyltransferase [uncultured Sphaerochaeta sp.]